MTTRSIIALLAAASIAAAAGAQHVDILLAVQDGQIHTGGYDIEGGKLIAEELRVFGSEFGELPDPTLANDPGFFALPGTFPAGSQLGFNILQPLRVWNGDGFELTRGETMRINFSSLSVTSGDGLVPGFSLFVQPDGGYHRHLNFFIQPPVTAGGIIGPGVYLLELEKFSSSPAIAASEPFWIVFNYQSDEAEHDAAIDWALDHLVGSPCLADLNADGAVTGLDLALLLGNWGPCPGCAADLSGDGTVNGFDLATLLAAWGPCP